MFEVDAETKEKYSPFFHVRYADIAVDVVEGTAALAMRVIDTSITRVNAGATPNADEVPAYQATGAPRVPLSRTPAATTVRVAPVLFNTEQAVVVAEDIAIDELFGTPDTAPEKVLVPTTVKVPPTSKSEENEPAVQFVVTSAAAPNTEALGFDTSVNTWSTTTRERSPMMSLFIG